MIIRSKLGFEGRGHDEAAMWADWSRKSGMRPFSVIRNRFGRFHRICESAVPEGADVTGIHYTGQHGAVISFKRAH